MLPVDALDYVLKVTGYLKNLESQKTIEAQNRVENIEELINAVIEYEQNTSEPTLSDYLENVALTADIDAMETDTTDMVTLMTLHSAKGLEFPFVFIVGMEEGYLPHQRSLDTQAELEEERRLCYVGRSRGQWSSYISRMPVRGEHFERRSIACNLVLFLKFQSISSSMWIGTDLPSVNQEACMRWFLKMWWIIACWPNCSPSAIRKREDNENQSSGAWSLCHRSV